MDMDLASSAALAHRDPAAAARELLRRGAALPEAQRRAIWARQPGEAELTAAFAAAAALTNTSISAHANIDAAPLAGVPYALKDLFHVAGQPTLAGGTFLPEVAPRPRADSAIVNAMRAAGAVCAGKTHLHEFAYGLTGENPHYGDVSHPHFSARTSGGSSSGSAAAVAAGVVPLAIGTDTGGSIRVPAAFCGLFGLRLTPHHPWIADAFPLAPSFDTPGFFTRTAVDLRTVLTTLLGPRPPAPSNNPRGCALPLRALVPEADPAIARVLDAAAARYAAAPDDATAAALREAFAGAAEAYGVLQSTEACAVHAAWLDRHRDRYEPGVWQRIDRGRRWTAAQLHRAQVTAMKVRLAFTALFATCDFLVLPATPFPALTKAGCTLENRNRLLALTSPASLAGLPVLTIPVPLGDAAPEPGLTSGLQIIVPGLASAALDLALDLAGNPAAAARE